MPFHFLFARISAYGAFRAMRNAVVWFTFAVSGAAAAPVTIVALGDSLTAGYGLRQEDGFVPQMQAWLDAEGAETIVLNAGVSGDTTAGGASRLGWALTPETDALIVNLGGNDMLRGIDPAEVRANLDQILSEATAKGLPVLLVGLRAPGNYGADYKAAFDAVYPDLAAKYDAVFTQNYFIPLIDQERAILDPALMQIDGIHPNKKGVGIAVAALGPKVLALIAKVPGQ
jgi:acyl-CoA thioesterase I